MADDDLPPSMRGSASADDDLPPSMRSAPDDLPPSLRKPVSVRGAAMSEAASRVLSMTPVGIAVKGAEAALGSLPVQESLRAVAERPEMQPLPLEPTITPQKPVSGPGDVVREAAGLAEDTLSLPIRTGATLQMPSAVAQEKTTDYLISKGANKYVALAGGLIAGAIADPINVMAAAELSAAARAQSVARKALKMELLKEDLAGALNTAKAMGADEAPRLAEWLKERQILNREVAEPEPMMPDGMRVNQSQLKSKELADQLKAINTQKLDLPVVDPKTIPANHEPVAVFIGNQDWGNGEVQALFNIHGDHPSVRSTVTLETLQKEGIPVIGRESRVPEGTIPAGMSAERPRPLPGRGSEPSKFKEIAIPEGEPRTELLRSASGLEVPQYTPKMTPLKTGDSSLIIGSQGMELDQPRIIGMEETRPNTGKISYEEATVLPKENKILVPEGYEPTRPETRQVPEFPGKAPDISEPGGVYGQPIEPAPTPVSPTESTFSEQTAHVDPPVSTEFYSGELPKQIEQWTNAATKELDDLNTSLELAQPSTSPHDDLASIIRRYVGHQELARFDASKMTDEFAGYIPDKDRRVLITLYSQLGRSPSIEELNTLRVRLGAVNSKAAKRFAESAETLMGQNLSLTQQENLALNSYNKYFKGIGENAKKMGILDKLREIYGGPHIYEPKADAEAGFFRKLVTGKSRFSQPRTFNNVIEAVEAGYVPKTLDSAELLSMYHNGISRAASERYLMDTLVKKGLINYEGRGSQLKGFQSGGMKINEEVYKRIPFSENKEVQKVMGRITEDPVLDYPFVRAIERFNNWQKTGSLYLQIFHPKALAMEAMGKGYSPAKFTEGMKMIEQNPDYVRQMIRSGLVVNDVKDVGKQLASNAVKEYRGANPVSLLRKLNDVYTDWVFGKYMTGLKIWNSNVVAKRFIDMGVAPERALELAVEDSNRTFGALNLKLMNRSPNMQRLFHMMAFAPDWTESRARQMASVFGRGIGDVTSQESKLVAAESRRYWARVSALAAVTHMAGMINPYEKFLSVDMSAESGFKDTVKVAKLLKLDPVYFSSKMAATPRTMVDFMNPQISAKRKFQFLFLQSLPINVQTGIRELAKEE